MSKLANESTNGAANAACTTAANAARTTAAPGLSRRGFLKGAAAMAIGITAIEGGYEFVYPDDAFADEAAPEVTKHTYCDMCNHSPKCGITATVKEDKIVRVVSRANYPNDPLCAKGLSALQELYDPHRLLHPMKRTKPKGQGDAGWEQITWDEAYDTIVAALNKVKDEMGPEGVFFYCGDPKEPRGAVNRLANLFGTPTYGNESSTCAYATLIGTGLVYGFQTLGANPNDNSKSCLIWSLNPAWSLPNRFGKLMNAKERGCKFIVVDPRVTPTVTGLADIHLQLRPGTDGALALGIAHVMLRDGYYDEEFCQNWTHGFDEFKEYVQEFTPEKVAEITWVPAEKIEAAAKLWGEETPGGFISSASPQVHHTNAGNNMRAIASLVALAGNVDVAGGLEINPGLPFDLFASTAGFNREDIYDADLASKRYDLQDFPVWTKFVKQMQTNRFPEYVDEGKIKAMVMFGGNAMMWPQSHLYQEAIGKLDFACAADYYIRPWTHDYVDIILPAAMCFERMAPFAVFGRKIYLREPVITPRGEAREDWQVAMELGSRLGYAEECFDGSVEEALAEVLRTSGLEVTMQDLRDNPDGYAVPGGAPYEPKKYETGKIRKDGQPGFNTPSGKIELVSEVMKECGLEGLPLYNEPVSSPISTPDRAKDYPLILNTGSRVPMYSHSKLRDCPWLNQFMPDPVVRLHPKTAAERGLEDGEQVRVFNHLGEIEVKLEVTNLVLPGVVDIFHGWEKANVNKLTEREFDHVTGYPPFKSGLCQVERA